jgi:hypothetical protein
MPMDIFSFAKGKSPVQNFNGYFSFRFEDVPDDSFTLTKELIHEGIELSVYRKTVDKKELGIFDNIEVTLSPANTKNINLKTTKTNWVHWIKLKRLVDHIYLFLGEDDENRGKWDDEDKAQFENGIFWSRYWLEERHNPKIMLSFSRDKIDIDPVSTIELRIMFL